MGKRGAGSPKPEIDETNTESHADEKRVQGDEKLHKETITAVMFKAEEAALKKEDEEAETQATKQVQFKDDMIEAMVMETQSKIAEESITTTAHAGAEEPLNDEPPEAMVYTPESNAVNKEESEEIVDNHTIDIVNAMV